MLDENAVRAAKELARIAAETTDKIVLLVCELHDKKPNTGHGPQDCFVVVVVKGDSKYYNDALNLSKKITPDDEHPIRIYP